MLPILKSYTAILESVIIIANMTAKEGAITVGGEVIPVPKDHVIDIGFIDIMAHEANMDRRDIPMVPILGSENERYPQDIIANLKFDIQYAGQQDKLPPNEIFRKLALRYHSDFYSGQNQKTLDHADNYTRVLIELKRLNQIEKISQTPMKKESQPERWVRTGKKLDIALHETIDIEDLPEVGINGLLVREMQEQFKQYESKDPEGLFMHLLFGGSDGNAIVSVPIDIRKNTGMISDLDKLREIIDEKAHNGNHIVATYQNHPPSYGEEYRQLGLPEEFALSPTLSELTNHVPKELIPTETPHIIFTRHPSKNNVQHSTYSIKEDIIVVEPINRTNFLDPRKLFDEGVIDLHNLRINPKGNRIFNPNALALSFLAR